MKEADILVVEDDRAFREALCDTLELAGYRVSCAGEGSEALARLDKLKVRLVLCDVKMAPMDGPTLLGKIKRLFPGLPVVLMTAYGTIEQAVQAIQAGACDYLVKPFSREALLEQVKRYLAPPLEGEAIAVDPASRKVYDLARQVAPTDANVLILGESGTGKEVLARYVHRHSGRQGAFVAINCAAIPEALLEAELFGYEKGAFTGALRSQPGKFELAQGGTLLLDEISEMNLQLQAKLLRVLQEKELERLGGRQVIKLDVRVIAISNRNLREEVAAGRFREDLYYRINVFPLYLPPLRARPQDIPPLAQALVARHAGAKAPKFSAEAMRKLKAYRWPGNVRELENVIRRALILCQDDWIGPEALIFDEGQEALEARLAPVACGLERGLRSLEEQIILTTLKQENGSRLSTARRLGISPRTLRYKLAKMREAGILIPS
jgi:two-component system response regulator FlrC